MATAWSGFSPEDQAKIKLELDANRPAIANGTHNGDLFKTADTSVNKEVISKQKKNKPNPKKILNSPTTTSCQNNDLPTEALFSTKTRQEKGSESPMHVKLKILEDTSSFEIMETVPLETSINNEDLLINDDQKQANQGDNQSPCQPSSLTLSVDLLQNGGKKDPVNLDEFEKKQKLIEEQNRLKKQMLAKALAMRKMKTQAEAQKLQQIQEELSKLDANLSNDVCILRSHIEIASVELSEAEKRYIKAEREFVEAKQLLFSKRERKDLLTEHLCAIIEQNELRKAHRLTDLMVQLDDEINRTDSPFNRLEPVTVTNNEE